MSKTFLASFSLLHCLFAFSNDSAHITFNVDSQLYTNKFLVLINDGINKHEMPAQTKRWEGVLYAPYGPMEFSHENSDSTFINQVVFFKKGNGQLSVSYLPGKDTCLIIDEKASRNIIAYSQVGGTGLRRLY